MNPGRDAQPAAGTNHRLGVIDIGSNSIRLVVYDRLSRAPLPIINRRAVVGLGTDVERLGFLGDEAFGLAVDTIDILVRTAREVPVADLKLLATAGVRGAANGMNFCRTVESRTGCAVTVLTGDEEARLSALGVVSASPGLTGVVGDLGGGSLELVALRRGEIVEQTSLDIGPLRLMERTGGRLDEAARIIDRAVGEIAWLGDWRGEPFHAVGGAWRAIARLHMAQADYPLRIVHGYRMARSEARAFTGMLEQLGHETIARIRAVSARRAEILPWGAAALERLTLVLKPREIIYSAHGLREGHHFRMLDSATQAEDPLLSACRELAGRHRRFRDASEEIEAWLRPVTEHVPDIDPRLVRAACVLADMGWSEHPEYRAEQSLSAVLHMPWSVPDHAERAFLALAMFVRYGGASGSAGAAVCHRLQGEESARGAKALGKVLRLALELCAGRSGALDAAPLARSDEGLHLAIGPEAMVASIDRVHRYAASAGRALGIPVTVEPCAAGPGPEPGTG